MVKFADYHGFNGTCAPLLYIQGCTKAAQHALMIESRFWLAAFPIAYLFLLAAAAYRLKRVSESFNTLRLTILCFIVGGPFIILFDALRVANERFHDVPPHLMGLFWLFGSACCITGLLILSVTWVSFASQNLLARPALTGNPILFWSIEIPFILCTLIFTTISGISWAWYFFFMRICLSVWSALLLILGAFAWYYGKQTLDRLKDTGDSFNYKQQFRILTLIVGSCANCGITVAFQAYFLDKIDNFYQMWILCMSFYRFSALVTMAGSALYLFYSTYHLEKARSSSGTKPSGSSNIISDKHLSTEPRESDTKYSVNTTSSEETPESMESASSSDSSGDIV